MKALRRHYLYAEQENESSVGDADSKTNVLKLWLTRRQQLLTSDAQITRYLALFWDLAKPTHATTLAKHEYVVFFQNVAKALVQSVNSEYAVAVATRDWAYDSIGGSLPEDDAVLCLPQFKEALFQIAELILPVESDASMFASFFVELRDAIASPVSSSEPSTIVATEDPDTLAYTLRPLQDVVKIRGAFLQKMPPNADHLAQIRGLAPPETAAMSLKQLLLSYNPRKFSLSRKFSTLFGPQAGSGVDSVAVDAATAAVVAATESSRLSTVPRPPSTLHSREAEDGFDFEKSVGQAISNFPALRVAVVGPPGVGKTRVARNLAKRLDLQYVSIPLAVEDAIAAKRVRDEQRRERRRLAQEARDAAQAAAAEATAAAMPTVDGEDAPPDEEMPPSTIDEEASPVIEETVDEAELLFGDEQLATLMRGEALPTNSALAVLISYTRKVLLTGVGVVVDGVSPSMLESAITVDFVVSLEMSREDAESHNASLMLSLVSRVVYSARERAMLIECDAVLREKGYGDSSVYAATDSDDGEDEQQQLVQRRQKVTDAMAAAVAALAPPKPTAEEGEEESKPEDDAPPSDGGATADGDADEAAVGAVATPPTPAQRNDIPPLDEALVPLRAILKESFSERYKTYLQLSAILQGPSSTARVIPVLAAQALADIVSQCVVAITNDDSGLCRSAASRVVLPITLPEDVLSTGNAVEQTRWLLYGDWTEFLSTAAPSIPFAIGPVDGTQPRLLSRWRLCCPVSSSAGSMVPVGGDPQWAAYYNGFIYLFASASAREAFAATPLQFIRREPPTLPPARKLWVLSSSPLDLATANALAEVAQGQYASALAVVAGSPSLRQTMELMEGKTMTSATAASAVAETLMGADAWVLTDLPLTKDTIEALREHGVVPDAVILLGPSEEDVGHFYPSPLDRKRYEQWLTLCDTADGSALITALAEAQLPPLKRCPLSRSPRETQAALRRLLSPLAPRTDSEEDGTMRTTTEAEDECQRVFAPATTEPEEQVDETEAATKKADELTGYDTTQRQRLTKRLRMGETARWCPVAWAKTGVLVPGLPQFVASYQQKLYAFAGAQELESFRRDPMAYIPHTARATASLIPVVFLLGVRGTNIEQSSASLAGHQVGTVDSSAVNERVERRLRAQLLLPVDKQTSVLELYVTELKAEVTAMARSNKGQAVLVANPSLAGVNVPSQLAEATEDVAQPSPLPSIELIELCYKQGLFPTLVVPLETSEDRAVASQLQQWESVQPSTWKRKKPAAEDEEATEDGAVDPLELEAAEKSRLQEQYQADQEALTAAVDALRARGLSVAPPVSVEATQRVVIKQLADCVLSHTQTKHSLFDYCERVSHTMAQQLLRSGQATVGKHGVVCPRTGQAPLASIPRLLYRGRLYFPSSMETLVACESSPAETLCQATSQPPLTRICCSVVGAPTTEKTRLARELAQRFGLVYVSPHSAMEWILQCLGPQSTLWGKLKVARTSGSKQLDLGLIHDAIVLRLASADCQRHGWVLDGYLSNSEELGLCLNSSESKRIHPGMLFVLERSQSTAMDGVPAINAESVRAAFTAWQVYRLELLHTWTSTFGGFHCQQIDTDATSAWQAAALATEVLRQHIAATRAYTQTSAMQRPATLYKVLRTQDMIEASAHAVYQAFCPVELASGRYHSTDPHRRELCVEYAAPGHASVVLWFATSENMASFNASPADYFTEDALQRATTLVNKAPVDASLLSLLSVADCEFPEMKGYCPVTFQQGTGDKDWQAIVKGGIFYRVSYNGKVFFCLSEARRKAFIRQPSLFASLILPTKLPPQIATPLTMKNCPGRIEQELSGVLNETLLLLGTARPKFVGISVKSTACFYLALQLKTRAVVGQPDHIRAKYVERLRAFERDCRLGDSLKAAASSTSCGPGVKGARAVRELSTATPDASDSAVPGQATSDSSNIDQVDTLRLRFDELTRNSHVPTNQQPATPRANASQYFFDYAAPFVTVSKP